MNINLNKVNAECIIDLLNVDYASDPEFTQGYVSGIMDVLSILKISLKELSNLSKEISINTK